MFPKDKAKELIDKFMCVSDTTELFRIGEEEAIKCAIILCEEIMNEVKGSQWVYWGYVKSELVSIQQDETKNR